MCMDKQSKEANHSHNTSPPNSLMPIAPANVLKRIVAIHITYKILHPKLLPSVL